MIIAVDGPAGSGKSTTARELAGRLGFQHLDSGAFYRALTLAALRAGIDPDRWPDLDRETLDGLEVSSRPAGAGFRVLIGGDDPGDAIRGSEVNAHVSLMARVPAVRDWLLDRLREAGHSADSVADGRDMGTVVFPDADLKVFLVADLETRARRRLIQEGAEEPGAREVLAEADRLKERDRIDSERDVAPLRRAPEAYEVDTTALRFDEQIEAILAMLPDPDVRARSLAAAGA